MSGVSVSKAIRNEAKVYCELQFLLIVHGVFEIADPLLLVFLMHF